MPPEIKEKYLAFQPGFKFDEFKIDTYSLGVIALEMCLLEHASDWFEVNNVKEIDGKLRLLVKKVKNKYSNELGGLIEDMVKFDPKMRYSPLAMKSRLALFYNVLHSVKLERGHKPIKYEMV